MEVILIVVVVAIIREERRGWDIELCLKVMFQKFSL